MKDNVIKCTAKLGKVLYPKSPLQNGDFGIVSMFLVDEEVGRVEVHPTYKTFVVKGTFCKLNFEDKYNLTMVQVDDKKWGKQYELLFLKTEANLETVYEQKEFLRVSLSERVVNSLYETFENPIEVIESRDIESLCKVKGIKKKTAMKIIERYESTKDNAEVYVKLKDYNLTKKTIDKLIKKYSSVDTILHKLKENIYILADEIDGIGFKKVDAIAANMGMQINDARRIKSFIMHFLKTDSDRGNSWVYTNDLLDAIVETCGNEVDFEIVKNHLSELREREVIVTNKSRSIIGLKKIFDMEMEILTQLDRIANGDNNFIYHDWESIVDEIENEQGWKYTDQQRAGVKTVLDNQVVLVTGLAGTGKSTVTNAMCRVLQRRGYSIQQCALSGRAAQRMKEVNGFESNTIHKTIGMNIGDNIIHNESNPLDADVVLLDEASMPDARIYVNLLKAIKTGAKLVIIGDPGQLPSIGIANVFFDLLEYKYPIVNLTKVHRQAQASAIISESINIRNNNQLFNSEFSGEKVLGELQDLELNIFKSKEEIHGQILKQFLKHYELHNNDVMKVQIVVPMKNRGDICTRSLNENIQARINVNVDIAECVTTMSGYSIYKGDKVINNTNAKAFNTNGEEIDIYNGNIGIVNDVDICDGSITVYFFDLKEDVVLKHEHIKDSIDLAYAITCHKLQGSSANTVIVGIDFSAYTMLSCEYLYTAITRAEKYAILVGENNAVRYAISNTHSANKQTFIKLRTQTEQ